jgi:phosphorylcholine metabolism protein LicD
MKNLLICALSTTLLTGCSSDNQQNKQTEFSIKRDMLLPVGMPLVSCYHFVRENAFLNTCSDTASPLEQVGNFLLTPSRFLFGGKEALFSQGTIQLHPSCSYDEYLFAKTALSLFALPLCEPLGALCKGLAFLSEEARNRHLAINRALTQPTLESRLKTYLEYGISPLHSSDQAPCKQLKRPTQISRQHQLEVEAFKELSQLLEAHQIPYWIDCGTCLGAYRYGGMIPWDIDIDISILSPDHRNVKSLLSQKLDPKKYQIQDWSSYGAPETFLKLFIKETNSFIDIYHYAIDSQAKTLTYFFTYKDSPIPMSWKTEELVLLTPLAYDDIFPLKQAEFDGLTVWAPNNIEGFLKTKYGDNLDPTMLWDEEIQLYKKVEDHPYWQRIK